MSVFDDPDLLLSEPNHIRDILVDALKGGYLSLFVGAGVSMSATQPPGQLFPSWPELVKRCCAQVGVAFDDSQSNDNRYLRRIAEEVEDVVKSKGGLFTDIVEQSLYSSCAIYDHRTLKADLLISLGSLVMSSLRGSVAAVVNYNFDDLLEWYLELHGFKVGIVSKTGELVPKSDVTIYHPHGFLPKTKKFLAHRTESVIFGERSYQRAVDDNVWNEIQRARFGSNICLFVGMSGDDPHVEQLFSTVHDQLKGSRILGVLLTKESPVSRQNEAHNKRRGVLNYYFSDYGDLPDFLLGLCRSAAELA